MKIELSPEEVDLLEFLLEKDVGETRMEVHHAKNMDFKAHLQEREQMDVSLTERLKSLM